MYHYAGNNPVRYTDLDGNFDVCWNQTLGDYNAYTPIKSVNTGNSCADCVVGTLAGSLNLVGACINIFSNVLGKSYELVNSATLATCRMDLPAISATMMANNLLAPAGIMLGSFNTYINGLKLASSSKGINAALTIGQQTVNVSASFVGIEINPACTALTAPYPPNNGAMIGTSERIFLMSGDKIDRYGSDYGKFFSPVGTPIEMRALPPTADLTQYNAYTVCKPFEVTKSVIAPYYGKIGLGIQYESPVSVQVLLKHGVIE